MNCQYCSSPISETMGCRCRSASSQTQFGNYYGGQQEHHYASAPNYILEIKNQLDRIEALLIELKGREG